MTKNAKTKLVAATLTAIAVAAAGTASARSTAPGPALTDPRAGGLDVALGEWSVGLEAKAIRPGRVTFVITNRGKVTHGFEIEAAGDRPRHDEDDTKLESDDLRPGQSARITVDLAPGVYEVECSVGDHDDRGMVALLTVRADAPLVAPTKAPANSVAIANFAFKPAVLNAKVGATVRWRNVDAAPHTATSTTGAFDSKILNRSGTFAKRFTRPGTYAYICALHPQMKGRVVVR